MGLRLRRPLLVLPAQSAREALRSPSMVLEMPHELIVLVNAQSHNSHVELIVPVNPQESGQPHGADRPPGRSTQDISGNSSLHRGGSQGGGRRSQNPASSTPGSSSTISTGDLESLLRRHRGSGRRDGDRPKSSIGSVKIEEFGGDRRKYQRWRKAVEAQSMLYRLEESEQAMLVHLSTRAKARDVLDQLPLSEFITEGGGVILWKLLDESFGETPAELFERVERELNSYRRLPGQSVATYLASMKRLRAQYTRVDPDSTISDRAWAQRLLNRASLQRRERLDVFYSPGGSYEAESIERALRHRCANVHEDERKVPGYLSRALDGGRSE